MASFTTAIGATSLSPSLSFISSPSSVCQQVNHHSCRIQQSGRRRVRIEAAQSSSPPKRNSILCQKCEGNGAVVCSQCKGEGVNAEDIFNGQFKAGATCWLCRGKREMLCGDCNGAGFMGGFLSSSDDI